MIVYHGSNSNFSVLRISPRLTKSSSGYLSEGYGIYFSLNPEVAKGYGKYLYILEVNDRYVKDYRDYRECSALLIDLIATVSKDVNRDLRAYLPSDFISSMSNDIVRGNYGVGYLDKDLVNILCENKDFMRDFSYSLKEEVFRKFRVELKKKLAVYMFTSEVDGTGIIKNVSKNIVKIVGKERS